MSISVKRMRRFLNKRLFNLPYWTDEEILALDMDVDELADFFDVSRDTIFKQLKKRKLILPEKLNPDKEYLRKQIEHLYFRQLMTIADIQINCKVGYYIVSKILKAAKDKGMRQIDIEKCNALTIDESVIRNFDSYRDAANVFPKKAGYKRAVY